VNAGEIRLVCRATSGLGADDVEAAIAALPADEHAHAQRFRFRDDARDYAAAHALLRRELSRGTATAPQAWQFDRGAHGKPFLAGDRAPARSFSLSHTRGMVACALAPPGVAIGVDIEAIHGEIDTRRLAARFFAETEIAALDRLPEHGRHERFYDLWTMKEAIVKALGVALPPALPQIAIEIGEGGDVTVARAPVSVDGSWQLAFFTPAAGYRLALAAMRPPGVAPLTVSYATADEAAAQPGS